MEYQFSIRFAKEQSPEYQSVLGFASKFRMFLPAQDEHSPHQINTSNLEVIDKNEAFTKLLQIISSWSSTRLIHDGKEFLASEFKLNEKKEIAACYHRFLAAEDKDAYCDDRKPTCWGCHMLSSIVLHHNKVAYSQFSKYWYQYGSFTDKNTWRVNREELSLALENTFHKRNIDFCPRFEHSFYRKYMAALPQLIHLPDLGNWDFVYRSDSMNSGKRWEPVGIMHIKHTDIAGSDPNGLAGVVLKDEGSSDNKHRRNVPLTTFADIGGIDEIIHNIRIMIELPLIKPKLFEHLGVKPYRGILLWGDPGNGKTLIAKAIAHEVNAHFIPISGPDILNKEFGQSEQNLREIFEEAKLYQPSVIFIDEIDSIAQTRFSGESSKWYATLVNQLLALMDGISDFGNITVLASTNRPDLLDAALLRPGRFDYKLEIRKPTLPGCKRILEIATKGMPLAEDVDLFAYSEAVAGYSAAEITFLAKEAAMVRLRKALEANEISFYDDTETDFSHLEITMADFHAALHLLKWHRRYVNLSYSLKDKKLT